MSSPKWRPLISRARAHAPRDRVLRVALGLALAMLAALGQAAQAGAPETLPAFLQPLPGAKGVVVRGTGKLAHVEYELTATYPAPEVLAAIKERVPADWTPLKEDYLNPGVGTGHVRGWTSYGDQTTTPNSQVHRWMGEWQNTAGDVLIYDLTYRSPGPFSLYTSLAAPTTNRLRVVGNLTPREFVEQAKRSILELRAARGEPVGSRPAVDPSSAVASEQGGHPKPIPRELDPDGLMHGLRFGSTEAQVIAALGPPIGVLQVTGTRKVLFFAKSHAFVFGRGVFRELYIGQCLFDWDLAQGMEDDPLLNSRRWVLKPGIVPNMKFGEVAKLLNMPKARPDYQLTYETEHASVALSFSSHSGGNGGPDEFELMAIRIASLDPN